jgi:hypothetical protein
MKTMTCKQLAGACEQAFHADTFEEIAEMSKKHAMEMFEKGDKAHLDAMESMKSLMQKPSAMETWFSNIQKEFDALPED